MGISQSKLVGGTLASNLQLLRYWLQKQGQCEGEVPGYFASFITLGSMLLVLVSLPLSLFFVVKVVQVSIIKSSI